MSIKMLLFAQVSIYRKQKFSAWDPNSFKFWERVPTEGSERIFGGAVDIIILDAVRICNKKFEQLDPGHGVAGGSKKILFFTVVFKDSIKICLLDPRDSVPGGQKRFWKIDLSEGVLGQRLCGSRNKILFHSSIQIFNKKIFLGTIEIPFLGAGSKNFWRDRIFGRGVLTKDSWGIASPGERCLRTSLFSTTVRKN